MIKCAVLFVLVLTTAFVGGCRRHAEAPAVVETEPVAQEEVQEQNVPEFDRAVHDAAMAKLAPVHHERMRTAAEARAAVTAYAKTREDATPEQLAADSRWQELKAASVAADTAREEVRLEIASRVRARMRHEAAQKRAGNVVPTAGGAAPVPPVPDADEQAAGAASVPPVPETAPPVVENPSDPSDPTDPPATPTK